jgi:CheY-like chemotaxis protein
MTVLVVEDDRAVRYLFTAVLRGNGYKVIACEDGAKGLEAAQAKISEIDAVITDATMPGLDGRELVVRIRALRPEMPVLVVSGTMEDRSPRPTPSGPATIYLTKPLSPDQLIVELRRALDGAASDLVR